MQALAQQRHARVLHQRSASFFATSRTWPCGICTVPASPLRPRNSASLLQRLVNRVRRLKPSSASAASGPPQACPARRPARAPWRKVDVGADAGGVTRPVCAWRAKSRTRWSAGARLRPVRPGCRRPGCRDRIVGRLEAVGIGVTQVLDRLPARARWRRHFDPERREVARGVEASTPCAPSCGRSCGRAWLRSARAARP